MQIFEGEIEMSYSYTPVFDNSLLPYGTETGVKADVNGRTTPILSLIPTFEQGIRLGATNYDLIRIGAGGHIDFGFTWPEYWRGTGMGRTFAPFEANSSYTVIEGEIWIDRNLERDSLVFTWVDVPQSGYQSGNWYPSFYYGSTQDLERQTYQIELLDRGDGQVEVIYRFLDMTLSIEAQTTPNFHYYTGWGGRTVPQHLQGNPVSDWDVITGNTGVAGVWQYMLQDGAALPELAHDPQRLDGTEGDDHLLGLTGVDTLIGGLGDDTLEAGVSRGDVLWGGAGEDVIFGSRLGHSTITADSGADQIAIFASRNTLGAGVGDDRITLTDSRHGNVIYGAAGADEIILARAHWGRGSSDIAAAGDRLFGGDGDDILRGEGVASRSWDWSGPAATFYGGAGDDRLTGSADTASILFGEVGNDVLQSGNGRNVAMYGGAGDDFLMAQGLMHFSDGVSSIHGDEGSRVVTATGGAGADRFSTGLGARGQLGLTITDYDADEGDTLVLNGHLVDRARIGVQINGVMSLLDDFTGWEGPISSLSLHLRPFWFGTEASTLFRFENAAELDRLVLRLPGEEGIEKVTIDLLV